MSVYRTSHENNFVVIDKGYLRDRSLSLKAKGLLTLMLSLPDDWRFSREGLEAICAEGHVSVADALRELKRKGYLQIKRIRNRDTSEKPFSLDYDIFESPELYQVGFNTDGNNTDGNETDRNNTDGNLPAYKELNNQERNNQEQNNQGHSHRIRGGGGGAFYENEDEDGERETDGQALSGAAGRPSTDDQRPLTAESGAYAVRNGIALSENNLKELEEFAGKLGDEAVVWAVDEALASGKKFYAYVRGILNNRILRGAKNLSDIRSMEERRHNGSDKYYGREGAGTAQSRFDCDITV